MSISRFVRMKISFRIMRMLLVVSGIQKNFLRILNCQEEMSITNIKRTGDTVSSTFENNFGNNNFKQCVLEPALGGSGGQTVHVSPYSQFNDLSSIAWNQPWWEEICKCYQSGLPHLCPLLKHLPAHH